jgi:c-di-GMP-binding flagellar brake protein YcgR
MDGVLEAGQAVHIEVQAQGKYACSDTKVVKVSHDSFTLEAPENDPLLLVSEDEVIKLTTLTARGICHFQSRVLGFTMDTPAQAVMDAPHEVHFVQRREYVRVPERVAFTMSYRAAGAGKVMLRCEMRDISAGGLRAVVLQSSSQTPLSTTTVGEVVFKLAQGEPAYQCQCRVVRVTPTSVASPMGFSVEFQELKEGERERIMRYVFAAQACDRR